MKALRKPLSLFMAMLMCLGIFAGTGTTAFAAGETMTTYYDLPAEKGIVGTSPKQPQTRFLPWATGCWALPIYPRAALFTWKPAM